MCFQSSFLCKLKLTLDERNPWQRMASGAGRLPRALRLQEQSCQPVTVLVHHRDCHRLWHCLASVGAAAGVPEASMRKLRPTPAPLALNLNQTLEVHAGHRGPLLTRPRVWPGTAGPSTAGWPGDATGPGLDQVEGPAAAWRWRETGA